jgi:ABC-type uncharacterized transport system auxiliary subunit
MRVAVYLSCLWLVAACSGEALTRNEPTPILYLLHATPLNNAAQHPLTISVDTPHMAQGLDTDRIALVQHARQMQYFAGGRWPGNLSDTLADVVVESLNSMPQATIIHPSSNSAARYQLSLFVSDFQAEYGEALAATPNVHVALRASLRDSQDGRILWTTTFDETAPAENNSLTAVSAAMERLVHQALQDIGQQMQRVNAAPAIPTASHSDE